MRRTMTRLLLLSCALTLASCAGQSVRQRSESARAWAQEDAAALAFIVDAPWRSAENRARNGARHPQQTLEFFGVGSRMRVVEISPGAGWYSEILGPYLRHSGRYFAAMPAGPADSFYGRSNAALKARFAADPERFSRAEVIEYDPRAPQLGAPGSADVVLTFRNVHNWVAADTAAAHFRAFHQVLKPGGVLGVVDHRAKPGTPLEVMKQSGYLTEELVIDLATRAGFRLDARSEVNANPADSTDHAQGVWMLPPTNRHDKADAEKYRAIGESDRMTLRFIKP
ncbi:class I SAM-dependent methyltransferase [Luteimonas sp. e5]